MINIEEQTTTNTVIFLGAGISYVAGVPIQSEILKTICNNKEIFYSNNGNIFIKFLKYMKIVIIYLLLKKYILF